MQVHCRGEVLGLPSAIVHLGWLLLLLRGDLLLEVGTLSVVINHLKSAGVILLEEPLVMEVVQLAVESVSMIDSVIHLLDLLLQLFNLLHLQSNSLLLELLSSLRLSNLDLASASLQKHKQKHG